MDAPSAWEWFNHNADGLGLLLSLAVAFIAVFKFFVQDRVRVVLSTEAHFNESVTDFALAMDFQASAVFTVGGASVPATEPQQPGAPPAAMPEPSPTQAPPSPQQVPTELRIELRNPSLVGTAILRIDLVDEHDGRLGGHRYRDQAGAPFALPGRSAVAKLLTVDPQDEPSVRAVVVTDLDGKQHRVERKL